MRRAKSGSTLNIAAPIGVLEAVNSNSRASALLTALGEPVAIVSRLVSFAANSFVSGADAVAIVHVCRHRYYCGLPLEAHLSQPSEPDMLLNAVDDAGVA